ncbi:MAG: MBL fold metallo-hydrolase [Gemmatimonadales bacterium]|nr:MBL fold metallo-hydrolase [Gemmatimonadales bacterium]
MDWKIEVRSVGPLQMNAVLISGKGPEGAEAVLIDPGAEVETLLNLVRESEARLVGLLATHGHFDHVGAATGIQQVHDLPLRCHPDDLELIQSMPHIQEAYGFEPGEVPVCSADLADGTVIPCAGEKILVQHIPGHSTGQVMFLLPGKAIVGDCLFAGSVGRTDLPGGDFPTLEKSIRERIYTLPDETVIICGHGPSTTVGREKASNPFVQG